MTVKDGGYDDDFVHYSVYVKPSDLCAPRKVTTRTSSDIRQVTCAGCLQQYVRENNKGGYFDR